MNPYALVLTLGLVALVQVSLLPPLSIVGVSPDLMLALVTGWAILRDTRSAAIWALIGGLWLDLLSTGPFGSYTLGLLAVASVAGLGGGTIYRNHLILPPIMAVGATLVRSGIQLLLLLLAGRAVPPSGTLLRLFLIEAGFNAILTLVMFLILSRINRRLSLTPLPLE